MVVLGGEGRFLMNEVPLKGVGLGFWVLGFRIQGVGLWV